MKTAAVVSLAFWLGLTANVSAQQAEFKGLAGKWERREKTSNGEVVVELEFKEPPAQNQPGEVQAAITETGRQPIVFKGTWRPGREKDQIEIRVTYKGVERTSTSTVKLSGNSLTLSRDDGREEIYSRK